MLPKQFQSIIEIASEIDKCCNRPATRKQRFLVKVRKYFINEAEAIGPDQPTVFLHAPAIGDLPVNHLSPCAERPSTIHSTASTSAPEEVSISVFRQIRAALKTMVSCGSHASLAASATFSFVVNSRGLVQCAIDFFRRLRRDGDRRAVERRYAIFEPVSARNTACRY